MCVSTWEYMVLNILHDIHMYGCMEKTRYILDDTIISRYVDIDNLDNITVTALQ